MFRARIETLERRQMFAAEVLSEAGLVAAFNGDSLPDLAVLRGEEELVGEVAALYSYIDDVDIVSTVGDFNGDGRDDLASIGSFNQTPPIDLGPIGVQIGGFDTHRLAESLNRAFEAKAAAVKDVMNDDMETNYVVAYTGGRDDSASSVRPDIEMVTYFRNLDIEVENDETHAVVAGNFVGADTPQSISFPYGKLGIVTFITGSDGDAAQAISWTFSGLGPDMFTTSSGGDRPTEQVSFNFAEAADSVWLDIGMPEVADVNDTNVDDQQSFVSALYVDLLGRPAPIEMNSITEGASNMVMLRGEEWRDFELGVLSNTVFSNSESFVAPVHLDLLGLHVDTSPIDLSVRGVDTWEHAYHVHGAPAANGIIGILMSTVVDRSHPTGNNAAGANFALADGSVKFIGTDVTGTASLGNALIGSPEYRTKVAALVLASDEYFARFTNTRLDDEATPAGLLGRGDGTFQLTHAEFEKWGNSSRFDRGYLSPGYTSDDIMIGGTV